MNRIYIETTESDRASNKYSQKLDLNIADNLLKMRTLNFVVMERKKSDDLEIVNETKTPDEQLFLKDI